MGEMKPEYRETYIFAAEIIEQGNAFTASRMLDEFASAVEREALEKAAKVADDLSGFDAEGFPLRPNDLIPGAQKIAAAIRELMKPHPTTGDVEKETET
jgi:hypothetical protein